MTNLSFLYQAQIKFWVFKVLGAALWLLLGWLLLRWLLLDDCFLDGCFLDSCSLDGCSLLMCTLGKSRLVVILLLCSTPTTFGCLIFFIVQALSFLIHPLSQQSQLGYLLLPTPHCAALVRLTGCHAIPLVTKCFPPKPCLGKQRIFLGVAVILSMCLCSHT